MLPISIVVDQGDQLKLPHAGTVVPEKRVIRAIHE